MKVYRDYKRWWIETQAPQYIGQFYWGATAEECFEQHVKDIGIFKLFETLASWDEEQ